MFLDDWSHKDVFSLWYTARQGGPPQLENNLINGTNTYDCEASGDSTCTGVLGSKYETVFEPGKKYLFRIINVATDGHFQFSIDGHNLTVIANDLVPIKPYVTDSVLVSIAQSKQCFCLFFFLLSFFSFLTTLTSRLGEIRGSNAYLGYDVIVEANADTDNYWLRAGWVSACSTNLNAANMTGIVRYDSSSTENPTSTSTVVASSSCGDEPYASLVPYFEMDVGTLTDAVEDFASVGFEFDSYFKWTINGSTLVLDWADPTLVQVLDGNSSYASSYNVVEMESASSSSEWALLIIEDDTGFG